MTKQLTKLASLLCIAGVLVWGQSFDPSTPDGLYWKKLDDSTKKFHLAGMFIGLTYAQRHAERVLHRVNPTIFRKFVTASDAEYSETFGNANVGMLVEGLDKFYDDYRNGTVFIYDAIRIVAMEISGHPEAEISLVTEQARRVAARPRKSAAQQP